MTKTLALAAMLGSAATAASATTVTFDTEAPYFNENPEAFSVGGLSFATTGINDSSTFAEGQLTTWGDNSPNGNATNALIFSDYGTGNEAVITAEGGGTFDLYSIDLVISWYEESAIDSILVNGVQVDLSTTLSTYVFDLQDVTSVTISGLFTSGGDNGYWLADNIVFDVAAIPVPAALPMLLLGLGGLGIARGRRAA